jgi:hypothetical protein
MRFNYFLFKKLFACMQFLKLITDNLYVIKWNLSEIGLIHFLSRNTQPIFADIIQKMGTLRERFDTNTTILNFAHEETVLPFLTAFGLYQDIKGNSCIRLAKKGSSLENILNRFLCIKCWNSGP